MRTATVFNFLIEATLTGSVMILLMLPIRSVLRQRLTSRFLCFAWLLVALRLLLPISLPNPMMNELRPALSENWGVRPVAEQVRVRSADAVVQLAVTVEAHGGAEATVLADDLWDIRTEINSGRMARRLLAAYVAAALMVAGWILWRNARFLLRLKRGRIEALRGDKLASYLELCKRRGVRPVPVYWVDPLPSACLVGVFRPYIALPLLLGDEDFLAVLTHELCHKKAGDPWWGLMRNVCCVIHWFNPLVWLAARLSRSDQEMACDERVIQPMNDEERIRYATALTLNAARRCTPETMILATGMTMKGRHIKRRVRAIVDGRAALRWLCAAALVVACAGTLFAFATSEYHQPLVEPVSPQWEGSGMERRAVTTSEEAEAYAKELLSSAPWLNAVSFAHSPDDLVWQVLEGTEAGMWYVHVWPPQGGEGGPFTLAFDAKGRIWEIRDEAAAGALCRSGNKRIPANSSYVGNDEYSAIILDFAHRFADQALDEGFDTLTIVDDVWRGGERCVTLSYIMAESGCEGTLSIQLSPQMRVYQLSRREADGDDVERIQASNAAWEARREMLLDRALEGAQGYEADFLPMAELDPVTKEQANQAYESLVGMFGYSFEDADRFVYAAMEQDATMFLVFHDAACPEWNYVMMPFEEARTPFISRQGSHAEEEGIRYLWYRVEEEGWFLHWQEEDWNAFVHDAIDYRYEIPFTDEIKTDIRAGRFSVAQTIQATFEACYGPEEQWSDALSGWRDATLMRFGR